MADTEIKIKSLRNEYHKKLQDRIWGYDGPERRPSNADRSSKISLALARGMLASSTSATTSPPTGQGVGAIFEEITKEFIERSFSALTHVRPGQWQYSTKLRIADFEQYAHLATLKRILDANSQDSEFRAAFSSDYLIAPDIVVGRVPLSDAEIN